MISNKKSKKEEIIWLIKQYISIGLLMIFFYFLYIFLAIVCASGHYEGTETRQPDGNYYVWVED